MSLCRTALVIVKLSIENEVVRNTYNFAELTHITNVISFTFMLYEPAAICELIFLEQ